MSKNTMVNRSKYLTHFALCLAVATLLLCFISQSVCAITPVTISDIGNDQKFKQYSNNRGRNFQISKNNVLEGSSFLTKSFPHRSITSIPSIDHLRSEKSRALTFVSLRGGSMIGDQENTASSRETNELSRTNRELALFLSSSFVFTFSLALTSFAAVPALVAEIGSQRATSTLSIIGGCAALTEIILSPAMGTLLDSIGRKPALLFPMICILTVHGLVSINSSVVTICASKFVTGLSLGLFGTVSQVVISDLVASDPKRMSSSLGLQSALNGLGFLVGAVGGGWLTELGLSVTYGVSAIISLLSAVLLSFGVQETLLSSKRIPFQENKKKLQKQLLKSPLSSSTRILFSHSKEIRILAILLMIQSFPMQLGTTYQVLLSSEWNVGTKAFSSFFAMICLISIVANVVGSQLIVKLGIKSFTVISTLSSIFIPLGALVSFRGHIAGNIVGFLGYAQSLGVNAALYAEGAKSNISKGELAGERSSFLALTGVIGPIFYSMLYVHGKKLIGTGLSPFMFNIALGLVTLSLSQSHLPN